MNKHGNPRTLVASHPGNVNGVKQGVHSSRLIQPRAQEIVGELTRSFEFSPPERLAVWEAARCMAILEGIVRDLDERGIVDKAGQPRYLLIYRLRISRQLEQWLTKIRVTTERQAASSRRSRLASPTMFASCNGSRSAVTRKSSTSERLSALEELLKLSVNGTTSYFDGTAAAELTQRWQTIYARKRAQEFDQLEHSLRHNRH